MAMRSALADDQALGTVFGDSFTSRLDRNLREDKAAGFREPEIR